MADIPIMTSQWELSAKHALQCMITLLLIGSLQSHYDVIKWKHCLCYWPFVRGIHLSPVDSPHKGQWCGALIFSLICALTNGSVNNRDAGDLRHLRHYDVTVMCCAIWHSKQRQSYVEFLAAKTGYLFFIIIPESMPVNKNHFTDLLMKVKKK